MTSVPDRPGARMSQKRLREWLRALRREPARKAHATRRQLEGNHQQLPEQIHALFDPLEAAFTHPTHRRFVVLALAAILTLGGRTVSNLHRILGALRNYPKTPGRST